MLTHSHADMLSRSHAHMLSRWHADTLARWHARTLTRWHAHTFTRSQPFTRSHGSRSHVHTRSHGSHFHTFARLCECAHVISGVHSLRDISHRTLTKNMVNRIRFWLWEVFAILRRLLIFALLFWNHRPILDSIVSEHGHMRCHSLIVVLWPERLYYDCFFVPLKFGLHIFCRPSF